MNGYIYNGTQEERILTLLKERGDRGAYVYEFMAPRPDGLGVAQYNARIWGLKQKGYQIINLQPGHFVLKEEKMEMSVEEIQAKLKTLRERWVKEPENRKILEIRGKLLAKALEDKQPATFEEAQQIFKEP